MDAYLQAIEKMPRVIKVFFSIFVLDIFWAIWRVVLGVKNKSVYQILVAIINHFYLVLLI